MAARRIRSDRQRKVSAYVRPPGLNVIEEIDTTRAPASPTSGEQRDEPDQMPYRRFQKGSKVHSNENQLEVDGGGKLDESVGERGGPCSTVIGQASFGESPAVRKESLSRLRAAPWNHSFPPVSKHLTDRHDEVAQSNCLPVPAIRIQPGSPTVSVTSLQAADTDEQSEGDPTAIISLKEWRPKAIPTTGDNLHLLKQCATKLNLPTRRPSYVTWRQTHFGSGGAPVMIGCLSEEKTTDNGWTEENRQRINEMLATLRRELMAMREHDQELAWQLMTLRRDIHDVKVSRYYVENRDLLEEAIENEERDELDKLLDLPPRLFSPALKHYGVTRMNVQTRRFSVF